MGESQAQYNMVQSDRGSLDALSPAALSAIVTSLTGPRKAAILCIMLGDEAASEIFRHLDEDEVQMISKELAAMRNVPPEIGESIVQEFHDIILAQSYVASAGPEYAKKLLIRSVGPENAKRILDKINRSIEETSGFETLRKVNPQQLAKFLQNEHPQTIAVLLANLDASTAADMLGYLPDEQRSELIMRLAHLQTISQDVIRRVLSALDSKLKSGDYFSQQQVGGVRTAAELCNRLDREAARKALEEIELVNPELALAIRNLMVTFDDLLLIDDFGIREILKYVDKNVLALALKGAVPEIQVRFFSNMAARASDLLREEMEYLGQVKKKDVYAAQREIVTLLRELDEKGIISLAGSEDSYIA